MKEFFMSTQGIVITYIIVSFIGVVLHDFKYLFFLNGNNKLKAMTVCGIFCIFNTICTKYIADQNLVLSLFVVTITNMISMYIAMSYNEKNLKQFIYKFEISIKDDEICRKLQQDFKDEHIPTKRYYYLFDNDKEDEIGETKYNELQIYAFTKTHSRRIENILTKYKNEKVKYVKIKTGDYKE